MNTEDIVETWRREATEQGVKQGLDLPVAPLGIDGAVSRIRGIAGTTITVTVHRGDQRIPLIVTRSKIKT